MSDHDRDLQRRIHAAHDEDRPPSFHSLMERRRSRPGILWLGPALAAAAVVALVLLRRPTSPKPAPPDPATLLQVAAAPRLPLDFLLKTPAPFTSAPPRFSSQLDWRQP